ncbi:MerR family transcriptional regulator [Actinoalloteichus spitiensis]|uniref:MerR family transcriptional regulator n=1 Tax=Actinoalloteichus spitiensis TaxID=252394 RepID=UPI00035DECF4|nr:MerR family transcriptional regulator [Actinoalloteichus spitiensis]
MGSTGESLTIGEVSRRTGLSIDTLRFYEREKLLPAPERSATGRRIFREVDVEWIGVCRRLRDSGMPLARIAEYAALVRAGAGNEQQRLDLLRQHEAHVREQMAALHDALDVISFKVATYTAALERGVADGLFVSDRVDDDRLGGIHDHDSVRAARVAPTGARAFDLE